MEIKRIFSTRRIVLKGENNYSEINLPSTILSRINLKYTALRSNPSLCGERLA
jgi:hypothetical protein